MPRKLYSRLTYVGNHLACLIQGSSPDSQFCSPPLQYQHRTLSLSPEKRSKKTFSKNLNESQQNASQQITHPRKRILLLPLALELYSSATLAIHDGTLPILHSSPSCEGLSGCCKETRFWVGAKMFNSYGHWDDINSNVTHSNRVNGTAGWAHASKAGRLASLKKSTIHKNSIFNIFCPNHFLIKAVSRGISATTIRVINRFWVRRPFPHSF